MSEEHKNVEKPCPNCSRPVVTAAENLHPFACHYCGWALLSIKDTLDAVLKMVAEGRWAPTGPGGCCLECGSWTPARHKERHDHKETCSWNNKEFNGNEHAAAAIRLALREAL